MRPASDCNIDQVVNYEVVLADGMIVQANKDSNADLYQVLKGGSNNFGIVTRFDLQGFPARKIWDASGMHPKEYNDAFLDALIDFGERLNETPDGHAFGFWAYRSPIPDPFILSMVVHLDDVADAPLMQQFMKIPGKRAMASKSVAEKIGAVSLPSDK